MIASPEEGGHCSEFEREQHYGIEHDSLHDSASLARFALERPNTMEMLERVIEKLAR